MRHLSTSFSVLLASFLAMLGIASCQSDIDFLSSGEGHLVVTLENVSSSVITRSIPSELGKPLAEQFSLSITNASDLPVFDGRFNSQTITLPIGAYHVVASYGDNPVIAVDAPYYVGDADVTIEKGMTTQANLVCKVSNALVSVRFGSNDAETARFDKFYSSYGLEVKVDGQSAIIDNASPLQSVYFRSGSSASLAFVGTLRADGHEVRTDLIPSAANFPTSFAAAEHAVVTLSLPDPESAAAVEISKLELSESTMEETIPLSWLPMPQVNVLHQYDANSNLVGTDLQFTDSYPGMQWKAEVKGDDQVVYRTISGSGALSSDYASNAVDWPYLPAGHYTATYYLLQEGKEPMKTGSRDFTVADPELKLTMGGYTSYTKYLEGDISTANACDNQTIYAPSASFNVAPALLSNAHYTHSFTASFDGQSQSVPAAANSVTLSNRTGVAPRSEAYRMTANASFAGIEVSASADFYVTGLPYKAAPPTQSDWSGSANSWRGDYVRLHGNTITKTFYVPAEVNVNVDQNVYVRRGTVATTYNLQVSSENLCAYAPAYNTSNTFTETFSSVLKSSDATVKCVNSYGNPDSIVQGTHAKVYSITVQYR